MKRKIISLLLSLILIIISVAPALTVADAAVWTGSLVVPPLSDGVYQISRPEHLAWFAYAVNSGNQTLKGVLLNDVQMNNPGSTANAWTPIGTEANPFKGTFDGGGYTISGIFVNSAQMCKGLFGYVYYDLPESQDDVSAEYIVETREYTIKNVNVADAVITGKQNVGGIAGYVYNAGIIDCSFSGTIRSVDNSVGGIVGWATMSSVISQCSSTGTVTGHQRVGGITGYTNGNSVTTRCYSDAAVSGYMNVGGIVGTLSASGMLGCFFLGSVSADDRAGGLVGYSAFGRMQGGYTISSITNTADGTEFGGAVGSVYSGTYESIFYSYEDSGVDGSAGIGRTPSEMQNSDFVKEVNRSAPYFCFDYTAINNGYPVLTWMLRLDVWMGDRSMPEQDSSGTYLISQPSELAWFAALVNGTLSGFAANPSANATVVDNLLFSINVYDDVMTRFEWTPIGTAASPYTGTFNGGGYNIAGLYTAPTSGSNGVNAGLFGYVGAGTIRNAVMVDCLVCGKENVGGIAGFLSGGTVTDCVCSSEIQGDRAVGGIAGSLGSSTSKIINCAMTGTINGTNISNEQSYLQNVGGIAGYSNHASITKSFSSASVNAPLARYVGGILGNSSTGSVTSCYSTSNVTGFDRVGGIVGYNNNGTAQRCYTAGKVSGTTQVGIAFGATSGSNVSSCYYDESFRNITNTVTGAAAKTPTQMTGSSSVSNLSLGSDFVSRADDLYFYYYPQISAMASSSFAAIKNASVKSVKRVQNKYAARVEIDGRTDTYYETLEEAFEYAANTVSSVLPTVFLVRDKELDTTLDISSEVCFFGENGAILTRAASLTGAMINVTGDLSIGSSLYGYDDSPDLYIDGCDVAGTSAAVVVADGATLRVQPGVCVENCRTANTNVRGAAVNSVGGTVIVSGGKFEKDISRTVGGAIYSENGTVTVTGGEFIYCEATQGCGVYNNNGTAEISGGRFTENIASLYGGAVAGYGVYSKTTVSGRAQLIGNQATYGGAAAVQSYGTLVISGGTISDNRAYDNGGAVYIGANSEAVISGGTFTGNYSDRATGGGVYNGGDLSLKGSVQFDTDNDIYLATGKYITLSDRLTCPGHAAVITPQNYVEGTKVLAGSALSSNYTKFGLNKTGWHILASGKLTSTATTTVALLSKNEAYSVEYVSLIDAFAAIEENDTAIITVVADNVITDTIPVRGDVTLICDENSFVTMRSGSYHGVLFDVQPDSILRFGDSVLNPDRQAQNDYASGTQTAGQMIIDGGALSTGVVGAAAVNVQSGGQFFMYDDAIIRNCSNTTTGTVTVSGTMHMYGGTICDNSSYCGGAVYVKSGGTLNTYGGVITGNTSTKGGDAVYSLGRVVRNINSYKFHYIETLYDGAGNITGMADPVYQSELKTDILADGDVYVDTSLIYSGETETAVYVRSLENIPVQTEFSPNNMTVALKTYTVGAVAVTGTNVAAYCENYIPYADGYYVMSDGRLGINKLVTKANSGYSIKRPDSVLTGIKLGNNKVSTVMSKFVNSTTLIKVVNAKGTPLRNTATVTTGCRVRLVNTSGTVIDEVGIVVYGDVNGDEKIDGQDAVLIRVIADGMLNPSNASAAELESADVNRDGTVAFIDSEQVEACGVLSMTPDQIQ